VPGVDDHLPAGGRERVAHQQHRSPVGTVDGQPPDLQVLDSDPDLDPLSGPGDAHTAHLLRR
jgi:hypothetical protein